MSKFPYKHYPSKCHPCVSIPSRRYIPPSPIPNVISDAYIGVWNNSDIEQILIPSSTLQLSNTSDTDNTSIAWTSFGPNYNFGSTNIGITGINIPISGDYEASYTVVASASTLGQISFQLQNTRDELVLPIPGSISISGLGNTDQPIQLINNVIFNALAGDSISLTNNALNTVSLYNCPNPSIGNSIYAQGTGITQLSAGPINIMSGSSVYVMIQFDQGIDHISSVVDTQSNTYILAKFGGYNSSIGTAVWYCDAVTGSPELIVTCTIPTTNDMMIQVVELRGIMSPSLDYAGAQSESSSQANIIVRSTNYNELGLISVVAVQNDGTKYLANPNALLVLTNPVPSNLQNIFGGTSIIALGSPDNYMLEADLIPNATSWFCVGITIQFGTVVKVTPINSSLCMKLLRVT